MATVATPTPIPNALVVPASNPLPTLHAVGPTRTVHTLTQAWMRTSRMTPALKAQIMANMAASKVNNTQANVAQVIVPPTEAKPVELTEPAELDQFTLNDNLFSNQGPPLSPSPLEINSPGGFSHISTLPSNFDFSMDDCLGSQLLENDLSQAPSATFPPWVMDLYIVTKHHGSWAIQCCTMGTNCHELRS